MNLTRIINFPRSACGVRNTKTIYTNTKKQRLHMKRLWTILNFRRKEF